MRLHLYEQMYRSWTPFYWFEKTLLNWYNHFDYTNWCMSFHSLWRHHGWSKAEKWLSKILQTKSWRQGKCMIPLCGSSNHHEITPMYIQHWIEKEPTLETGKTKLISLQILDNGDYQAIQNQILSMMFLGFSLGQGPSIIVSRAAFPVQRSASLDLMNGVRLTTFQKT